MIRYVGLGRLPLLCFLGSLLAVAPPVDAATNAARAGIGGLANGTIQNGDGTGPARITIDSVPLALIKQARDSGGAVLPGGAGVRPDQELWFVLFVENPTAFPAVDVRLVDLLDESQFVYVTGSLEQCTVPAGTGDAALWAATWSPLSDGVGAPDDEASIEDTTGGPSPDRVTLGRVPGQSNAGVTIPPGSLRAFRFRVRVY